MTTVSVVIPTLNEEANIGRLLRSLREQHRPPDEIIVVDGGSDDATVALAAGARILRSRPPVGAQRQVGLEAAKGEIVVFLDADTEPGSAFLERALEAFERRRLDVAIPRYVPATSNFFVRCVFAFFNLVFLILAPALPSGGGMCIIARRAHALAVGGFRSDLVYEDIEFIRRAARRGRFGVLAEPVRVSPRRFEEHGHLRTLGKYLLLSVFFTFGLFRLAGVVPYRFSAYARGNSEERVVLVDESNNAIGTAPKSLVHTSDTPLHRGFSAFVFDGSGRLLLQRRSAGKVTWPLTWSNSCCGHPALDESALEAAKRRLSHELGLTDVRLAVAIPDYRYRAQKDGIVENEICPVIVGVTAQSPSPRPDEVSGTRWVNWRDFVEEVRSGKTEVSPWCVEETLLLDERFDRPWDVPGRPAETDSTA